MLDSYIIKRIQEEQEKAEGDKQPHAPRPGAGLPMGPPVERPDLPPTRNPRGSVDIVPNVIDHSVAGVQRAIIGMVF